MGYTTDFEGEIKIDPPLSAAEIKYLTTFAGTRRQSREQGPYYAVDDGDFGQSDTTGVIDGNNPPEGQPGLWCKWVPNEDGTAVGWDGGEKFYHSAEWMNYIIEHFLKPRAKAVGSKHAPGIVGGHVLNGVIKAEGEDRDDNWWLIVKDNVVSRSNVAPAFLPHLGTAVPIVTNGQFDYSDAAKF